MNLYEKLLELIGNDVLGLFGPPGSGKSTFCYLVALDALKLKKRVFYLDVERNLDLKEEEIPQGLDYRYTPDYREILDIARSLPQADLYILDSFGMSVLPAYAEAPEDRKDVVLLKAFSLMEYFKLATYRNKSLAIVTNQPFKEPKVSEELRPWGDWAVYLAKEIWRTSMVESKEDGTVCEVKSWRSRMGEGKAPLQADDNFRGS